MNVALTAPKASLHDIPQDVEREQRMPQVIQHAEEPHDVVSLARTREGINRAFLKPDAVLQPGSSCSGRAA
jgi:hypothetical protein